MSLVSTIEHENAGRRRVAMSSGAPLHVVSGVLLSGRRDGCLLMGLRAPGGTRPDLWEFPGGKVEPHDAGPRAALAREWREELSLDVDVGDRIATGIVDVEMRILIEMFEVRARTRMVWLSVDPPRSSAHVKTCWVHPTIAVTDLPCSPGFYVHLPFLRLWLSSPESSTRLDR